MNSTSTALKRSTKKSSEFQQKQQQQHQQQQSPPTPPAALATPPPIPKRTFRNKFTWNSVNNTATATTSGFRGSPTPPSSAASINQTPTKGKQQKTAGTAFVYPQTSPFDGYSNTNTNIEVSGNIRNTDTASSPLYVDVRSRSVFSEGIALQQHSSGYDTSGASDDDRMSLENSVFEESLNSTPVKLSAGGQGKQLSTTLAAKTLAALTGGDISNAMKRSNRSSSSTVDSSITSSGYGSSGHSERFASTSTTADFRSRFSSVDTQSSVDSCLTERTSADSPLTKENPYKPERHLNITNEVMHSLNNNEMNSDYSTQSNNNNNNSMSFNNQMGKKASSVPSVPARGGQRKNTQLHNQETSKFNSQSHSQQSLNNSIDSSNKASSTVPNSTSTSSTASAGSSISTGSSMSISGSGGSGNSPLAPQPQQTHSTQHQKRPPIPPARVQNFELQDASNAKNFTQQPALNIRNQLNRSKRPPPIQYPKLHQRQDSNLSSDSFSATSSPGYNSKNLMDAPLLQNAARINKSNAAMAAAMRHQDSNDSFVLNSTRFNGTGPAVPPRHKFNFRQDSTISSDSFSQTSSPGYNTKIMEAPLLPSLSVKRLCNGKILYYKYLSGLFILNFVVFYSFYAHKS